MNEPLAFEAFYPHPAERVWQALTDPSALGRWLLPADFRPQIGFRFQFQGGPNDAVTGVVIEAEPPKRLSYTWQDDAKDADAKDADDGAAGTPSVVTWTLEPKPGGTKVRLEHQPSDAVAAPREDAYVLIEASANWRYAMHHSLPLFLRLLAAEARRPPTPIVYVEEEPQAEPSRRAGFRQEGEPTRC